MDEQEDQSGEGSGINELGILGYGCSGLLLIVGIVFSVTTWSNPFFQLFPVGGLPIVGALIGFIITASLQANRSERLRSKDGDSEVAAKPDYPSDGIVDHEPKDSSNDGAV